MFDNWSATMLTVGGEDGLLMEAKMWCLPWLWWWQMCGAMRVPVVTRAEIARSRIISVRVGSFGSSVIEVDFRKRVGSIGGAS